MDPIRNLVSGADPIRHEPAIPDGEEALRRMLARAEGYTDRVSPDIPTLAERRQRRARIAGLLTIAAAAVTAGVLVTMNLGPLTTSPAPAGTAEVTRPEAPAAATALPPTPTPTVTSGPSTGVPAAAGPTGCTKENVTGIQGWFAEQLPSAEVAGCAGDWMALSMTGSGGQTDAGSWFWMATLVDGRYVFDGDQPWANIPGWDVAGANNDRLTAEQFMDSQFTSKGIPVQYRQALVGVPAPGSLAAQGVKTYVDGSTGYKVSFDYPATWKVTDPAGSLALTSGAGTSLTDNTGKEVARLALGETNEWSGCLNEAPYRVLDSEAMSALPSVPGGAGDSSPRFAYVAMASAANDGGPIQAGIGITNRIAGPEGTGCVLDLAVAGPDALNFYSFTTRRPLGGPTWGLYRFQTMEEAMAFTKTAGYQDLKRVITSLTFTKTG